MLTDMTSQYHCVAHDLPLPDPITQHDHRTAAHHIVPGVQPPAQHRLRSEHVEELTRHECCAEARDALAVANRPGPSALVAEEGDLGERAGSPRKLALLIERERIVEPSVGCL